MVECIVSDLISLNPARLFGGSQGGHENFAKRNSAEFRVIFISYFRENFGKIFAE
jgi:hypothetical protein